MNTLLRNDRLPDAVRDWTRTERVGLGLLLAFTIVAVAGFGVFGRHPRFLAALPAQLGQFYGVAFGFFAQAHVILSSALLLVILWRRIGWRWLPAFGLVYGISLLSELAGTRYGIPFGAYSYSELLGPRWLGLVPVLIPLSWFAMAIPSYALGRFLVRGRGALASILAGSLILVVWDLSLDPAMSYATRYWAWSEPGPYYGMPLINLVGWYVTGLALMAALHLVRAATGLERIPVGLMAAFYAANILLPAGINAVSLLPGALIVGLVPLGVLSLLGRRQLRNSAAAAVMAAPARIDDEGARAGGRSGLATQGRVS